MTDKLADVYGVREYIRCQGKKVDASEYYDVAMQASVTCAIWSYSQSVSFLLCFFHSWNISTQISEISMTFFHNNGF